MNKRGISPVIATVLILMVTIAAVAMLAGFIVPYVKKTLSEGTECLDYKDYFQFEESANNCIDSTNHKINVSVKAIATEAGKNISKAGESEKNIAGFNLVFNYKDGSQVAKVRTDGTASDSAIKMFVASKPITIPRQGEWFTYVYNFPPNLLGFTNAEVYPALKSGRVCDRSDSIRLINC